MRKKNPDWGDKDCQKRETPLGLAHRWKPGQSGNPAGKPPGSYSLKAQLAKTLRDDPALGIKIIMALIKAGADGNILAIKETIERIDGKEATRIELDSKAVFLRFMEKMHTYIGEIYTIEIHNNILEDMDRELGT